MNVKHIIDPIIELPIPSDMSETSVDEAIRILREIVFVLPGARTYDILILECPSQILCDASVIAAFRNGVYVNLNVSYQPDEWSVYRDAFLGHGENMIIIQQRVHSDGA